MFARSSFSAKALAACLALCAVATPALADGDALYYEQNRQNYISHKQAAKAAQAHVGGGQVKDVEFDRSRMGPDHFDVEVVTTNGVEYDVKVDAKTGQILRSKIDD